MLQSYSVSVEAPLFFFSMFPQREELLSRPNDLRLHSCAPWFRPHSLYAFRLAEYVDDRGLLPGGIPASAIHSFEWCRRIAVKDQDLELTKRVWRRGRWWRMKRPVDCRVAMVEATRFKMGLISGPYFRNFERYDLWKARTNDEVRYARAMRRADPLVERLEESRIAVDVSPEAILWDGSILLVDYTSRKKAFSTFWNDTVPYERKCRMELGYFVPWHNVEVDCMARSALDGRYVRIPHWWVDWEMPQGFWAELPPVLAYAGSVLLHNPDSGWWVVHRTQWVINIAMYLVWDAYDTGRLWYCPPKVLSAFHTLPFCVVLGVDGARDLRKFVAIIESVDWSAVPAHQSQRRGSRRPNLSPGRSADSGDFVWVDAHAGKIVSSWSAKRKRAESYAGESPFPRVRRYRSGRANIPKRDPHSSQGMDIQEETKVTQGTENYGAPMEGTETVAVEDQTMNSSPEIPQPSAKSRSAQAEEIIVISSDSDTVQATPLEKDEGGHGGIVRREDPPFQMLDVGATCTEEIIEELDCGIGRHSTQTVLYDAAAMEVIHRCLEELMVPPHHGFAVDSQTLRVQLRGFIDDFRRKLSVDAETPVLFEGEMDAAGRLRTFFNMESLRVVHHFLGSVDGIPHGGFGPSTVLLRRQLCLYLESLREAARKSREI